MGVWGIEPWDNDTAADWYSSFFTGIDVEDRIIGGLEDENPDRSRAAAYLLSVLGRPYVWPGDPARLGQLLDRAIGRMESLAADTEYLAGYEDGERLLISIANLVSELQALRNETRDLT